MGLNEIDVRCYSGHTYAERPESFRWEGKDYEVVEVVKAWQEPGEKHFLVCTGDNKTFQLCYNGVKKQWWLVEIVRQGVE